MKLINEKLLINLMSEKQQKICNDCNHEESRHNVLREPYGHLCIGCFDGGSNDPCRNFCK